ncbi:hypothetical protein CR513_57077, partial [Mucuna pruriens]
MYKAKPMTTPIVTSLKLNIDISDPFLDPSFYHSVVGVKRILRYRSRTIHHDLLLISSFQPNITTYYDFYWSSDLDDHNSTSGCCVYLSANLHLSPVQEFSCNHYQNYTTLVFSSRIQSPSSTSQVVYHDNTLSILNWTYTLSITCFNIKRFWFYIFLPLSNQLMFLLKLFLNVSFTFVLPNSWSFLFL